MLTSLWLGLGLKINPQVRKKVKIGAPRRPEGRPKNHSKIDKDQGIGWVGGEPR